jgi:predicted TIM-barrel fold metal-dependent hydrolase
MIIDAHAHLGDDQVFDEAFTEQALLESQRLNGIALTLVQPATAHDLDTARRYHDAIAHLAMRYPGKFIGIANPNPHLPDDSYEQEIRRCVGEMGFCGIKLHPFAHAVNPVGRHGRRLFTLAAELEVPVIVHTGPQLPWSAPSLLDPIAELYPHLPIILAHGGGMAFAEEATQLASRHANIFLEGSWTGGFVIREWVRRLGASRVLFGSDHADNAANELHKYRNIGLAEEDLTWILGRTAATLFHLRSGTERGCSRIAP